MRPLMLGLIIITVCATADAMVVVGPGSVPLVGQKVPRTVAAYLLDEVPVTNRDFAAFVAAHPEWRKGAPSSLFIEARYLHHWGPSKDGASFAADVNPDGPVVFVSWFAARAFCDATGKRLPMSAEWELAAQASTTTVNGGADPAHTARVLDWYSRPTPSSMPPVGQTQRNAWGVFDLNSLVWEWVEDFQSAMVADDAREGGGLQFCGGGGAGAADATDYARYMRYAYRASLEGRFTTSGLGFRCARSIPKVAP
jgi:sulfatase modifying factor 1